MATFIASALAGVEAEDKDTAYNIAKHEELPWEVTGVAAPEDLSVVLSPAMQMQRDPRQSRWPMFGKASLVFGPLLAYGAFTGESSLHAIAELATLVLVG